MDERKNLMFQGKRLNDDDDDGNNKQCSTTMMMMMMTMPLLMMEKNYQTNDIKKMVSDAEDT